MEPPLFVLGVRRSGTTLLRVMLDRHPALAVPDESYFIPALAARHRGMLDVAAFCDDLARIPVIRDWEVDAGAVRGRLAPGARAGDGIAAVYEAYAALRGKERWGDKTPMYMGWLNMIDRLFPAARYVHLIRDGRDAALSFLAMPQELVTTTWMHPRDAAGFACQWRTEVRAARALGARLGPERYRELRYEELVADPEAALTATTALAGLEFDPIMLEYAGTLDLSRRPHQARLSQPPTPGLRDWRSEMAERDVAAFEAVAGDTLAACGYPLAERRRAAGPDLAARARLARYRARALAWRASAQAIARSPLWRRRHPRLA
ncbi:MAG TPA: sulfotransferase [Gaiellales bacterium]|nr:sulfotransferase [Gaiellales bacterium]